MKKLSIFTAIMMLVVVMASCGKDYTAFIGTWGVERIEYYNIDYAGDPIPATIETYYFKPGDMENGIDLVFRADKTGEMRDRSRDTLFLAEIIQGDTIIDTIICPDTTLVTNFTYSYNHSDNLLFMNMMVEHPFIYQMKIDFIDDNTYVYENEYDNNYVEKAWMVRYSTETRGNRSKAANMKRHPGSFFSN